MIHEHELELAAAAIDFELTPAERSRLDAAIAECSVCARAAASYRRGATMLAALPVVDASPSVRRQVERAAGLRPRRTSWSWVVVAAALLGLLLTSALIAGAIYEIRQNDLSQVAPTPLPSESPTQPTQPSQPPPDVIALDPPSGDLANVGAPLAYDSMAVVVTDNLRLRSAPFVGDLSVRYERFLRPDDRLFVVDGPVIAQNYEWYQVKAWRPRLPTAYWPVGWVARAGHDGEVWFRASTSTCPPSPVEVTALLGLAPMERVACYGNATIEIQGVVAGDASGDCDVARAGCAIGPALLTGTSLVAAASTSSSAAGGLPFAVDPDASVTAADLAEAGVVRLRGAFDDADAATCRPDPARPGPDGPLSPIDAVLSCRGRFVATQVSVESFPRRANVPAITISDHLRVRSLPEISDASIRYEPLLPLATRLWVLNGPAMADGYAWYEVIAPIRDSGGAVSRWLVGWVAAAGKDGERWIETRTIECPAPAATVLLADLAAIRQRPVDDGPLACFGGSEIQIEGTVTVACAGAEAGGGGSDWLLDRGGTWLDIRQGSRTLRARIDPARPLDVPCGRILAGRYRVTGHYDDPAASGCTSAKASLPIGTDQRVAVYWCRMSFVATGAESLEAPSTVPTPRGG